jgi:hypothetical protein
MKIIYLPLVIIVFLSVACSVRAQSPTEDADKNDKTSSFKFGINYLNNNVFMGRADTVHTPTIVPEVKYSFKNGLYFSGSIDVIPNRVKDKLDAGSLAVGYDYDITDDLGGGVSFTKLFYNPNSTQIGSSISSVVSADIDYNITDIITPSLSVDYNFIKQGFGNDIFVNVGLAHDFAKEGIFSDKDLFILSPTAAVNTGTQNFYDAYFTLKKNKSVAGTAAEKKLFTAQKEKLSKYNLLDYEFSAPLEYKTGVLILSFVPTYSLAENKLPPRITTGMVNQSGIFFFEAGAALKF